MKVDENIFGAHASLKLVPFFMKWLAMMMDKTQKA